MNRLLLKFIKNTYMRKVIHSGKSALTLFFCFLMLQCVSVHSSGDDNTPGVSADMDLSGFTSVSFNIAGKLYVKQDSAFSVKFEGKDEDLKKIIAEVKDNQLVIKTRNGSFSMGEVIVYVSMPRIEGLNVAGSGDIKAEELVKSSDISLSVSGSGNIYVDNLQAKEITSSISGSGNIAVKGTESESLNVNIAGSGDFDSRELSSKDINVSIAGSGSANVYATQNLITNIAGSGDVTYKGNPLVNASSVGSGSTKAIN
jgi:hypothetical protein